MPEDLRKTGKMTAASELAQVAAGQPSLLVSTASGAYKVPLPSRGEFLIGRGEDCTLRLDDTLVSRRHALLRIDNSDLELVDLGSSNGTRLGDRRVEPNQGVEVRIGDVITVGTTVLVVQAAWSGARARHIWSHGYFEARVEDECARADHGGRPFAILRLRVTRRDGGVEDRLVQHVRPMDVVAVYAPDHYEVLIVDADAEQARDIAHTLADKVSPDEPPLITLACYGRDGHTPEALLADVQPGLSRHESSMPPSAASTRDGALRRLEPLLRRVANGSLPALILGETGVGKDVVSRWLHEWSPRASKPYVCVNCAAIAENLLESELFGYEKGAFTGAAGTKQGLLESADGGTVLLDEIGEMPMALQSKLLRVIEQREVVRVGALRPRRIDVRFLAATHRDLPAEIARGRFRQDLYFRLAGIEIVVPPLRERVAEIAPLARRFAAEAAARGGVTRAPVLSDEAIALLEAYAWPGNVRELRNVIERAVLLCSTGGRITPEHLPVEKMGIVRFAARTPEPPVIQVPRSGHRTTARVPVTRPEETLRGDEDDERARIIAALRACRGNQTEAARVLGVSRRTLVSRLSQYELPRPRKDRDDE